MDLRTVDLLGTVARIAAQRRATMSQRDGGLALESVWETLTMVPAARDDIITRTSLGDYELLTGIGEGACAHAVSSRGGSERSPRSKAMELRVIRSRLSSAKQVSSRRCKLAIARVRRRSSR